MGKYALRARHKLTFCDKCHRSFKEQSEYDNHFLLQDCEIKGKSIEAITIRKPKTHQYEEGRKPQKTYGKETNAFTKVYEVAIKTSATTFFSCDICHETFTTAKYLNKHKKICHGLKPFVCDVCFKSFSRKRHLNIHSHTHSANRYVCDVCNKFFVRKGNLDVHFRVHTGEKPFACEICKESFISKALLSVHMFSHNETTTYTCECCSRVFRYKSHLTSHLTLHNKKTSKSSDSQLSIEFRDLSILHDFHTKPFICEMCSREFSDLLSFEMHACLSEQKPFVCDVCSKAFCTETEYNQHLCHSHESNT